VCWEFVLILGSIPVFRSAWMILDDIGIMNRPAGILLSFAAGIILCLISLYALNRTGKEKQVDDGGDNR
jgi:hypothetical protein